MQLAWLLLEGIGIGIAVAAPVGPVGLLCIQRTLQDGPTVGVATGIGAATADGLFGLVAAFGLAQVADYLVAHSTALKIVGGFVLLALAWRAWQRTRPRIEPDVPVHVRVLGGYSTGLAITLSNPMTIMGFVGIFAALGLEDLAAGSGNVSALVLGVLVGSGMWWLGLCGGTILLKPRFGPESLSWTNRLAAVLLAVFGGVALVSGLM